MSKITVSDEDYFLSIKRVFNTIFSLFVPDISIGLTDREKILIVKQANSFKLNIKEGDALGGKSPAKKALETGERQFARFPREVYGFPVATYSVPCINEDTGNVVGNIIYAVSQELEETVLGLAGELQTHAAEFMAITEELASSVQMLDSGSHSISRTVNDAKEHIMKTDDILQYIRSVAETTNLLGLNAAIEAARAGENGRGFSVVAEEIRKLAQNSKSSAAEITNTLSRIRDDINNILGSITDFAAVSEEQSAQTQQIASSSQKLAELSTRLHDIAGKLL